MGILGEKAYPCNFVVMLPVNVTMLSLFSLSALARYLTGCCRSWRTHLWTVKTYSSLQGKLTSMRSVAAVIKVFLLRCKESLVQFSEESKNLLPSICDAIKQNKSELDQTQFCFVLFSFSFRELLKLYFNENPLLRWPRKLKIKNGPKTWHILKCSWLSWFSMLASTYFNFEG